VLIRGGGVNETRVKRREDGGVVSRVGVCVEECGARKIVGW